jgi:hypothetical protein
MIELSTVSCVDDSDDRVKYCVVYTTQMIELSTVSCVDDSDDRVKY